MLIVQMRVAKDVHGVFQTIFIVAKLEAAGDGKNDLRALAHVQRVNGSRVLDHIVTRPGNPVISDIPG